MSSENPVFRLLLVGCRTTKQIHQCQTQLTVSGELSSSVFYHNNLIRAHNNVTSPTPMYHNFALFRNLFRCRLFPDSHTFPAILKTCSLSPSHSPLVGLSIQAHAIKSSFASHLFVNNALIHFHSVLGDISSAQLLLRIPDQKLDSVSYNTMISAYARAGDLSSARNLFDEMPEKDDVSWSAMIAAYVQGGSSREGLLLFRRMQEEGVFKPVQATLVSVLAACAHLGELEQGKWVHGYLKSKGICINVFLGTALIDMYCKCGQVELGMEVFDNMSEKNLLVWTTLIKGLAMHGRGVEALELFYQMEKDSTLVPDDVAFLGALCACTHAGLVDQGRKIFETMTTVYGMEPKLEHYGCLVDLLARNGLLEDAMSLIKSMPMEADAPLWGALMAGCRYHGNLGLAEVAVKHLIKLEPENSGVYVLLANIYATSGRHEDARDVRLLMQRKGVEKTPGCSSIDLEGRAHQFFVGDTSHPQMNEILMKWEEMERLVRLEGYVPEKKEVLLDVDEEEKEVMLARHSEKLAVAFGLLNSSPGMTIRVVKNLRVCTDCHLVIKLLSKVYDRKIVVRDRTRFHVFENGMCTCNEYW